MSNWFLNEGLKWLFMVLWIGVNIGLFAGYFDVYYNGPEYYYLRVMTGPNLAIARASAAALNFDCLLILLPVCRNLMSFLRGSCSCCRRNVRRQLDKHITFHRICAYMICFLSAVHYYAHTFNFEYFLDAFDSPNNETRGLLSALATFNPSTPNNTWINPIRNPNTNLMLEAVKTVAGITGIVITIALIVIVSSATETIRRSYFEVFWFTHHLFAIFFIGLVVHGVQGLVRSQVNLDEHDPYVCQYKYQDWGKPGSGCAIPVFKPGQAKTWYWVIAPMFLYFIERCIRFYRSQQNVVISKAVMHPSRVLELQMKRKGFRMEAGQYIFLHCPSLSRLEWHPFTLTSSPHDDHFSVHVRQVGDWTTALAKSMDNQSGELQHSHQLPSVAVDGPFGTASVDIFRYQVDVLVAAGIGVTPFASVLKDVWYRYSNKTDPGMKLRKVYFYWLCPDMYSFEWFADLLKHMEHQMAEAGMSDFLNCNLYLTRWKEDIIPTIVDAEDQIYDVITGLAQRTYYGKPNWDDVFSKLAADHPGTSVGVFFCGPAGLSTTLHKMSNKYSSHTPDTNGTRFFYNKENF